MSEDSQVKLRSAQSRLFDTTDHERILRSVVNTMQDLNFMIEVLDEELGIVSGKFFAPLEQKARCAVPSYQLYDDQSLMIFTRTFRDWGPFCHRNNLVRLTVTVRQRNQKQSVVRASAQFYLRALEDPKPYQKFFFALQKSLFLEAQYLEEAS